MSMQKESAQASHPVYLQNRETSWLKFNERVLDESSYEPSPLLERLRFIAIFTSNLDEFYMVRVGALTDYMLYDPDYDDSKTGMSAAQQLEAIYEAVGPLYVQRDEKYAALRSLLAERGVHHYNIEDLSEAELKELRKLFKSDIQPLLSPQIIDATRPFPHLANKQLHIAVQLESKREHLFGLIPVPESVQRVIPLRGDGFLLAEDLILHFSVEIFKMYTVTEKNVIAVTRNADLNFGDSEEEIDDYRQHIRKTIKKRPRLSPVRLELQYEAGEKFLEFFLKKLNMAYPQILYGKSPLDFSFCDEVENLFSHMKTLLPKPHIPVVSIPEKTDMMALISRKDILLSYPFESVSPFLDLIHQAAVSDSVVSIKITLYRIDVHSKLAQSLIQAAENDKEVVVIMELRARFDEDNNIQWAERLEQAGCKVVYGLPDFKVHSKVCLITRMTKRNVSYITQIGTGNYNERTSKQYTDISLMTADPEIGSDAQKMFNYLLIGNLYTDLMSESYERLIVAPSTLKEGIIRHIDEEIGKSKSGLRTGIIIKCNSITDRDIIEKLAEASDAGVKVRMIIRGICCIVPGLAGHTENISVTSIVGKFLEHSRIFCFGEGEDCTIYISSADLMTRNTTDRVEVACPILDRTVHRQILDMLDVMLRDNVKSWEQLPDGRYIHIHRPKQVPINSQIFFARNVAAHEISEPSAYNKLWANTLPVKLPKLNKLRLIFRK